MNNKRRLINRVLHGAGIVYGLDVVAVDESSVVIQSGLALDSSGREIVVPSTQVVKLSTIRGYSELKTSSICLGIAYAEEKTEPRHETELAKVEDATIKECETFLQNVLQAMHMEVELCSKVDEEGALSIEMKGDNMGILIGKRGQTLDSLQYLTNRVANKMQAGYVRVKLDTEDYRERRKETLENLARNIAHKVKRTRKPVTLEPMNPYERRIIHSALQGDKNVTTHSEGEEPYRRVVVTLVRK